MKVSHIPLPCGAALLPLPLGTSHETNICFKLKLFSILYFISIAAIVFFFFFQENNEVLYFISIAAIVFFFFKENNEEQ